MAESNNVPLEQLYEIEDVANWLHVHPKTIRRYLQDGMFENYITIKHAERNRTLFTQVSIDGFIATHMAGLPGPERLKRAYNKRAVKGKHKRWAVK